MRKKKSFVCQICFKKETTRQSLTCSDICHKILTREKSQQKYGCDHPSQSTSVRNKFKQTCFEKYGCESPIQNKKIQEKIKQTCLKKYGVENPLQSELVKTKRDETNIKRYGTKNPIKNKIILEKRNKTNMEKYGVEYPLQSNQIRKKSKTTHLEKYGTENPFQTDATKNQIKKTSINKYGCDHPSQSTSVRNKFKQTCFEKYGVNHPTQKNISLETIKLIGDKKQLEILYKECNENQVVLSNVLELSHSYVNKILHKHQIEIHHPSVSTQELEVLEFIKSITQEEILTSDRVAIKPLELDIFIPSKNISVEFNGCYWHSGAFKDRNYHYNKWKLCKEQGIFLIQIMESDWLHKQDIVKSLIASKLAVYDNTIYARKCDIRDVSYVDARQFLQQNHLQGNCVSKIRYGLYYENKLVSLMTFGKSRFKKDTMELIRFCNLLNTRVVGGTNRLFKHFIRNNQPTRLVSYSDCDYFDGKMYEKLGFKEKRHTGHSLWFVDLLTLEKHNRFKYMKHKQMDTTNIVEYYGSGNLEWSKL